MACNPLREVQRHPAGPRPGHGWHRHGPSQPRGLLPFGVERANTLADGADRATGAVAASDAFFPFADGARCYRRGRQGHRAAWRSIRDEEVIEAAKKAGVTMYLTGTRHFFH